MKKVSVGKRDIGYSVAGRGTPCLVFQPLGVSSRLLTNFTKETSLQLICIDRPGVGATSPILDGWSTDERVRRRLETHTEDISSVLDHLGVDCDRAIGLCAGTPFLFHFAKSRSLDHVTLVTPWVSPECNDASYSWSSYFLGRYLSALFGAFALRQVVDDLLCGSREDAITAFKRKLTRPEQLEFYQVDTYDIAQHAVEHSESALHDDLAVLLTPYHDYAPDRLPPRTQVVVFAADRDELVNPKAIEWFCRNKCPRHNTDLLFVEHTSHLGMQTLRSDLWVRTAAAGPVRLVQNRDGGQREDKELWSPPSSSSIVT